MGPIVLHQIRILAVLGHVLLEVMVSTVPGISTILMSFMAHFITREFINQPTVDTIIVKLITAYRKATFFIHHLR